MMETELLLSLTREALLLMIFASAPPLLASLAVGFAMSVFQATTSIQESTLSVVPKLCSAALSLVIAGPWIGEQFTRFTSRVFSMLSSVAL